MAKSAAQPIVLPPLPAKFSAMEDSINSRLVERTKETRTAITALVGGVHAFLLGPPGTAKSKLTRTLVAHIDDVALDEYFERLLTRYSTPEEVFGPPSLNALKQDIYRRNVAGMLPTAKIAFVDEIFKANSSILNSLLSILNERIYYNDVPIAVPLSTMFCASNELPQGEELEALYDRIHFRHIVKPIQESGNFVAMLKGQIAGPIVPAITWDEVLEAKTEAEAVVLGDEIFEAINSLRQDLKREGIEPTDRRWAETLKVIRATAWLGGRSGAEIDDMRLLRFMLWTRPDEQTMVDTKVLQLASPLDAEAMSLRDDIDKLASDLDNVLRDSDSSQTRNRKAIDLHGKLDKATAELESLKKRANDSGRKSEIIEEIQQTLVNAMDRLLKEVFSIDPTKMPKP